MIIPIETDCISEVHRSNLLITDKYQHFSNDSSSLSDVRVFIWFRYSFVMMNIYFLFIIHIALAWSNSFLPEYGNTDLFYSDQASFCI